MDALALDGRTTEAPAKFDDAQAKLAASSGAAPSDELRAAHERARGTASHSAARRMSGSRA